jgi:hypothetical protein
MKKKLDEAAIADELRTGSLFFRRAADEATAAEAGEAGEAVVTAAAIEPTPSEGPAAPAEPIVDPTPEPPTARPSVRTVVRPPQRVLKRHAFEFYQDQLDGLKQLSLADQMAGGRGNMSEMVREAVDAFLAQRRGEAPNGRTGKRRQ